MEKKYQISGMTCEGCKSHVEQILSEVGGVNTVSIDLVKEEALFEMDEHVSLKELESVLKADGGKYGIHPVRAYEKTLPPMPEIKSDTLPSTSIVTYKPLILIIGFIAGVCTAVQFPFTDFSWMLWMRHFMAGFFLVFSFFKLLNIKGFADSYAMYDLLAAKWKGWGWVYPFVELGLGFAYLINFNPSLTNWLTVTILGFSSLGVIKSNLDKQKIKCACLGDVFNLPMSTVTIVEDLAMVAMAGYMLIN